MMDFKKLKGLNWVGNIYEKFEAIVHEVDDVVNQDSIKLVGLQMQTVGKSVKKLCTDVQDLLPPLGDHVKHTAQNVAIKEENSLDATKEKSPTDPNVMDYARPSLISTKYHLADKPSSPVSVDTLELSESDLSVGNVDEVSTNENFLDAMESQSPTDPNVMDPVINQLSVISNKTHLAGQPSSPSSMDTLEVSESDLSLGNSDELLKNETSFDAPETQSHTESNEMHPAENQLSLFSSKYHLAEEPVSPKSRDALDVSESEFCVGKMDEVLINESYLDTTENQSPTDESNEEIAIKVSADSAPMLLDLTSPVGAEYFKVSPFRVFAQSNHQHIRTVLPEVAPATPAHGLEFESQQKSTVCDNSADEIECGSGASYTASEIAFSVAPGENTIAEMGVASFSSSNAMESLRLSEYSPENLSLEGMFSHNSAELAGCASDGSNGLISSASPLLVCAEGTSRITSMTLTVPARKQQASICESLQYDTFSDIVFSDESSCDFSHSRTESIDLHDKVKPEESCILVEDSELHSAASRTRKLRSYKKRIQDAFTSKKRLAKEYEQLAIWFGDTDIDGSQGTPSNMKTSQTHHACDSEWELL